MVAPSASNRSMSVFCGAMDIVPRVLHEYFGVHTENYAHISGLLCGCQVVVLCRYCRSISCTRYQVSGVRYCSYSQHLGLYIATAAYYSQYWVFDVDNARAVLAVLWVDTAGWHVVCCDAATAGASEMPLRLQQQVICHFFLLPLLLLSLWGEKQRPICPVQASLAVGTGRRR